MWIRRSALLALLSVACRDAAPEPLTPQRSDRPHVVLVVADDLGYADLGFTGAKDLDTPRLDALAAAGVVCTDAHVCASVCAPSRAGLLTGRYPQRFGFECNLAGTGGLPEGTRTLAHRLTAAGYETALVGKWHLGAAPHQHPLAVGFEHFTGLVAGSRSYFPALDSELSAQRRIERDGTVVPESSFDYLTDFLADEAARLVRERDATRPLFLVLAATAPHTPMHGRADLVARYAARIPDERRRTYAAMVTALDEGVGRLVDALEEAKMLDDTLLVFLSDNGGATNNASDNGPWRGMKGSKWEGGQRVPFLVHWPARLRAGRYGGLVSSLDLAVTALAAAGRDEEDALDGVDLTPYLAGERNDAPRDALFWRRDVAAAARVGEWKLVRVREEDSTFRAPLLVDLARHPDEATDSAGERPELVQSLQRRLEQWEHELEPPAWVEGARWQANQRAKHEMGLLGREAERRFP